MVRRWLILAIVAILPVVLNAQTTPANCPSISVSGPAGIIAPGDFATFVVSIDVPDAEKEKLRFVWTTSIGEIESGQGTASIAIRRRAGQSLIASVEVAGLPAGCPNTASELVTQCDGLPVPAKIAEFQGASFKGDRLELNSIVREMNDNPTNQLFIFFAYPNQAITDADNAREHRVLSYLSSAIGGKDRITTVRHFEGIHLVQFWRVPPGASNPTCDECGSLACPSISVTGPAGITMPGDTMVFTATVSGRGESSLVYKWMLGEDGVITGGQGTPHITVQTPNKLAFNITAILEVEGLDAGCPNRASVTAPVAVSVTPLLIDEYAGEMTRAEEMARLDSAGADLANRPDGRLYLIAYFTRGTSSRQVNSRRSWLKNFLVSRGVKPERIVVVSGGIGSSDRMRTKIYFVPAGAEYPAR